MSCFTTSATRRSRSVPAAVLIASAAASSHEVLLVPMISVTRYTLMAISLSATYANRLEPGTSPGRGPDPGPAPSGLLELVNEAARESPDSGVDRGEVGGQVWVAAGEDRNSVGGASGICDHADLIAHNPHESPALGGHGIADAKPGGDALARQLPGHQRPDPGTRRRRSGSVRPDASQQFGHLTRCRPGSAA